MEMDIFFCNFEFDVQKGGGGISCFISVFSSLAVLRNVYKTFFVYFSSPMKRNPFRQLFALTHKRFFISISITWVLFLIFIDCYFLNCHAIYKYRITNKIDQSQIIKDCSVTDSIELQLMKATHTKYEQRKKQLEFEHNWNTFYIFEHRQCDSFCLPSLKTRLSTIQ